MKKFYKHGQTITITLLIALITGILIAVFLSSLSNGTLQLTRLEVNENTSFIDFYTALVGGILGGIITLAGVALTIVNSDRKHAEQLAIEYRPYLDAIICEKEGETICEVNEFLGHANKNNATVVNVHLAFTNKGRGFLSGWNMKTITPYNQSIDSSDLFMSPGYNFYMTMKFYLDPKIAVNQPYSYTLNYNDEFNNQYTQRLHFIVETETIREDESHNYKVIYKDIGIQRRE